MDLVQILDGNGGIKSSINENILDIFLNDQSHIFHLCCSTWEQLVEQMWALLITQRSSFGKLLRNIPSASNSLNHWTTEELYLGEALLKSACKGCGSTDIAISMCISPVWYSTEVSCMHFFITFNLYWLKITKILTKLIERERFFLLLYYKLSIKFKLKSFKRMTIVILDR